MSDSSLKKKIRVKVIVSLGFPGGSVVKSPPAKQEISSGSLGKKERFPGEGNGNPLQCSHLDNPVDRGV